MGFKVKRWFMAVRIVKLALRVRYNRAVMRHLLKKGGPYTSPRLVRLDAETVRMGNQAYELICTWETMLSSKVRVQKFPLKKADTLNKRTA